MPLRWGTASGVEAVSGSARTQVCRLGKLAFARQTILPRNANGGALIETKLQLFAMRRLVRTHSRPRFAGGAHLCASVNSLSLDRSFDRETREQSIFFRSRILRLSRWRKYPLPAQASGQSPAQPNGICTEGVYSLADSRWGDHWSSK